MVEDMLAVPRLLAGFGRLHARLHGLPLDELGPDLALGDDTTPLDELTDRADAAGTEAVRDAMDSELTWLAKYLPSESRGNGRDGDVLCHGELNPVHVYVTDADPDTAVAVNWTRARRAEPAFDVAATVTAFWTSPLYVEGTVQRTAMKMVRDSLISAYLKAYAEASAGGLDDDAIRYWQAFHLGSLATDLARRVHDEPVAAWEAAASVPNPAGALDDVRKHFRDLTEG
jgi:aminoglycoside phosphotransferase (APT) family kinase protein